MVDVKTETKHPEQKSAQAGQSARRHSREAVKQSLPTLCRRASTMAGTVKALPPTRACARYWCILGRGTRFRDTLDQGVEWPNDAFTARRIADGSVRTDGPLR